MRRWVLIGALVLGAFFLFGILGGLVNLITDLWWYGSLGRTSILTTRLWSQIGLFVVGFLVFAVPALVSIWVARRIAPQVPIRRIGQFEIPDASRAITWTLVGITGCCRWCRRAPGAEAGRRSCCSSMAATSGPSIRTSSATSASTSSTCPSGASCRAGPPSA